MWCYDLESGYLAVLYGGGGFLSGVDNVTITAAGDVLAAEDGGDLEIVAITPRGALVAVCQLVGHDRS